MYYQEVWYISLPLVCCTSFWAYFPNMQHRMNHFSLSPVLPGSSCIHLGWCRSLLSNFSFTLLSSKCQWDLIKISQLLFLLCLELCKDLNLALSKSPGHYGGLWSPASLSYLSVFSHLLPLCFSHLGLPAVLLTHILCMRNFFNQSHLFWLYHASHSGFSRNITSQWYLSWSHC
jgi:hypothetical protein